MSPLRILTLTTLYPNAANETHGVFVENRLRQVVNRHSVEAKVIAPVPFFPFKAGVFGTYADFAKAPRMERRYGIDVYHPRYALIPKIGMTAAVSSLQLCFEREIRKIQNEGWDFDLIDAHYYYPDGVAAARLAEKLGKPVVITARGTDINLIPSYPRQRRMILEASAMANASISVCQALKDEMKDLGFAGEKITVLRNGVNLETFAPLDRSKIREQMNLSGLVLLSVGHLIERKGHDLVIQALSDIENATLLIAGSGPEEQSLQRLAQECGVASRVRFLGSIAHADLANVYNAADILVLGSSREGWPNVLLEAMACGTPCVATPVWGNREVIAEQRAGMICKARTPEAIADAVREVVASPPERSDTRNYAEQYSWNETSDGVMNVFTSITRASKLKVPKKSVPNWNFHEPLKQVSESPSLLVTVDTEEVFDWDRADFDNWHIADPKDISSFQDICERHDCIPLYFITWPLMRDEPTAAYFKHLAQELRADLGLHLHTWVTPPQNDQNTLYTSYQCNLSAELHKQKLSSLVHAFQEAFEFNPVAHRAGRYGVSPEVHRQLAAAGVLYDFSPSAGFDHSSSEGPDFSGVNSFPWWRDGKDGQDPLLCMPVTGGRCLRGTRMTLPQRQKSAGNFKPLASYLRKITAPVRLTPEHFDLQDMQALSKAVIKDGCQILTLSLHSTSLTEGATPYSKTRQDIQALLEKTDAYLTWFQREIGEITSLQKIIHKTQSRQNRKRI